MGLIDMEELEIEKYLVSTAMMAHGGSFVKKIGEALGCSDAGNTFRIKKAFPEYWEKYLKVGKADEEKEQAGG